MRMGEDFISADIKRVWTRKMSSVMWAWHCLSSTFNSVCMCARVCVCACVFMCMCMCLTVSSSWTVHGEVRGLVGLQSGSLHSRAEHLHLAGVASFPHVHLQQEMTSVIHFKSLLEEFPHVLCLKQQSSYSGFGTLIFTKTKTTYGVPQGSIYDPQVFSLLYIS